MNANNLMAVSTADGISAGTGASKGRAGVAGNRAQVASGKNLFSDTFGALQKGMDAGAAKTETRNASASAAQTKVSQAENNAPSQDTQDVTAQAPKAAGQQTEKSAGGKISSVDDSATSGALAAAVTALVNTDAVLVDADMNEGLDSALMEILQRYGLTEDQLGETKLQSAVQNLLQQLPEDAAKSRNLLLALSGQPLAQENVVAPGVAAAMQNVGDEASVLRMAALDAMLSAQLRAALNTETAPTEVQMTTAQAGGTSTENPLYAMSAAEQQSVQSATENMTAPILKAQTGNLPAAQGKNAAELIGENLIVDEGVDAANPLTVLAQRTMRHDMMQGDTAGQDAQQGQLMQNGQQLVRADVGAAFEIPTRGTETTPQPAQPIAAQTGLTQAQEVVSPAPTQETQRPQPDYEIPRQIVEQARLLRTLTDTQMVIRLRPEHLGELTLRVAVGADGAVQASFHSDNAHVRNVIENSLVQLRQELNNQGIKIDRVGVYAGLADGQMPQSQGQEAWQQSSGQQSGAQQVYTHGDADDYLDEIDGLAPIAAEETGGSVGAEGVDYRV